MPPRADPRLVAVQAMLPEAGPVVKSVAPAEQLAAVRVLLVADTARRYCISNDLDVGLLRGSRLLQLEADAERVVYCLAETRARASEALIGDLCGAPLETIGAVLERTLDLVISDAGILSWSRGRKPSGSYFTPEVWTRHVMQTVLRGQKCTAPKVLDPAAGAGAFLIAAARALSESGANLTKVVATQLHGVDKSELAIAACEASLTLLAKDARVLSSLRQHLRVGNALITPADGCPHDEGALDTLGAFPSVFSDGSGFDLVVGNPPWVAFAGRAAKPLPPEVRAFYARRYAAFRGYPTLHALFVERAAELAPQGTLALLLPSPIADLDGYRAVRSVLARSHTVREPLLELGQDAFAGVTQPCFVLLADPGTDPRGGDRAYVLSERTRRAADAAAVQPPEVLAGIAKRAPFPDALFGEMGFQSSGEVSKRLFLRGDAPDAQHTYPLLEGRNVREFHQDPPRLFLHPDAEVLARSRCRLRPAEEYTRARFVVRQTAAWPIAALHGGLPFRNSLLAGFAHDALLPEAGVALLNSALYRALHLAARRDARQAAFPQMKVGHLRGMPAPDTTRAEFAALSPLTRTLTESGVTAARRLQLDQLVFALFDVSADDRTAVMRFLAERAPKVYAGAQS
ncbi:MAG TPA: N-6 DNA methylase [Polyangiaceae bacterium]|nr:N-6 DNA methylase [Polyangiaceae bacterium]